MAPGIVSALEQAADTLDASSAMLAAQRQMLEVQGKRMATLEALILNLCTAIEIDGGHMVDTHAVRMTIGPTMVPGDTQPPELLEEVEKIRRADPPNCSYGASTVELPTLAAKGAL